MEDDTGPFTIKACITYARAALYEESMLIFNSHKAKGAVNRAHFQESYISKVYPGDN